jgi:threonine dehydrogenase-like Zn-dependent dehydrogenase
MSTIKAIAVPPGKPAQPAELLDVPQPQFDRKSVLVKTKYVGICATDIPYLRGDRDQRQDNSSPVVAFHEVVGEVVEKGLEALPISEGTLVVPLVRRCQEPMRGVFLPCRYIGECPQAGHPEYCPREGQYTSRGTGKQSGFGAQFFTDDGSWLVPVSDKVRKEFGDREYLLALAEPMSISQNAVRTAHNLRRARARDPGPFRDNVLVVGLGPIGLLAVFTLVVQYGYTNVYGADIYSPGNIRTNIIEETGPKGFGLAGQYIQVDTSMEAPQFWEQWIASNKERLRESGEGKFQIIIEATGRPEVVGGLLSALAPNGVLIVLGIPEGKHLLSIPADRLSKMVTQSQVLSGSVNASRQDFVDGLDCLAKCYRTYPEALVDIVGRRDNYSLYSLGWLDDHIAKKEQEVKAILNFDV